MSALDGQVALVTGRPRASGRPSPPNSRAAGPPSPTGATGAADSAAAAIVGDGGRAMAATGDVTDFGQVESVRRQIEDAWGPVGILVANAAAASPRPRRSSRSPKTGGAPRSTATCWPRSSR